MNADHAFLIGQSHSVCQDYALSGVVNEGSLGYAVLCDGCSTSPDTDVGARLIAITAREVLLGNILDGHELNYNAFGSMVICRSGGVIPHLKYRQSDPAILEENNNSNCLDATLLVGWVCDGLAKVFIYGDGCFFHRRGDHILRRVKVEFNPNGPDYLSYRLAPSRSAKYNDWMVEKWVHDSDLPCGVQNRAATFYPVQIFCSVEPGDVIVLTSDGIDSFEHEGRYFSVAEMEDDFTNFKTTEGLFAQRRMNALRRKCLSKNIHFHDDLSIAAIVV